MCITSGWSREYCTLLYSTGYHCTVCTVLFGVPGLLLFPPLEAPHSVLFCLAFPQPVQRLPLLESLSLGVFTDPTALNCLPENGFPRLNRLKLESTCLWSAPQLLGLRGKCPKLESLHLLWEGPAGASEWQICPVNASTIAAFSQQLVSLPPQ